MGVLAGPASGCDNAARAFRWLIDECGFVKALTVKWLVVPLLALVWVSAVSADTIRILAAENFYGDVARQIGGARVSVSSILRNPDQDPHLFQASAKAAREVADAQVVLLNGAGYDRWMQSLLHGAPSQGRAVIDVGQLMKVSPGANPHLWYDPRTMRRVAVRLSQVLSRIDPQHRGFYGSRLHAFVESLQPVRREIKYLRRQYAGEPVAATEPVFGYMARALGLRVHEQGFQTAMMNDVEPSVSEVIKFDGDLRQRRVRVLIYNSQVTDRRTTRLRRLAHRAGIPVVGVTETEPPHTNYQAWMLAELQRLGEALHKTGG